VTSLGQKAERALRQAASRVHDVVVRRQGQNTGAGVMGANAAQGLDSAHPGHRDIHDHHVRREFGVEPAGGFSRVCFGDDG
jgi:hypothetical protein